MTWNLTLDILLVLLILLFAPIGYMRGPVKEILVTLGVVYGALLVEFWARPWGRDLDYYFDVGDDAGAFIVAMSLLMGTTFIGGFGLGLLFAPWHFSTQGRVAGGVAAMVNGALLVAFSLQYVRLFLLSDANEEALEESYVVWLLMDQVGWLMMGAALVVPGVIVYGLVTHRRAYDHGAWGDYEEEYYDDYDYLDDDYDYDYDYPAMPEPVHHHPDHMAETRAMPPRIHTAAQDEESVAYKTEPEPLPIRTIDQTRDVRIQGESQSEATRPVDFPEQEWVAIGETDPEMAVVEPEEDPAGATEDQLPEPVEPDPPPESADLPEGYFRCANCHAVLPPDTRLCPVCGHVH